MTTSPSHAAVAQPASTNPSIDLGAVKERQRAMWASGDFAVIGTTLQIVGETLCEAVDLRSGASVLDVACGNGNATLAAARRFCKVTGTDYVPALLERAARRAAAECLEIRFVEGDAERLPFPSASFDVVLSTFGVMFAPDHPRAAHELCRVCVPGGTIGLANWTPEGFIGRLLAVVARHVPPMAGLASPILWGTDKHLTTLFASRAAKLTTTRKMFSFRYESAEHFIEVFRRFYGPTHKAFAALDAAGQQALSADLARLLAEHNVGGGRSLVVPAEYLEVVIETRG
jgi:ubiquinone/menaquinone biosynthesis C-methylase UbiE